MLLSQPLLSLSIDVNVFGLNTTTKSSAVKSAGTFSTPIARGVRPSTYTDTGETSLTHNASGSRNTKLNATDFLAHRLGSEHAATVTSTLPKDVTSSRSSRTITIVVSEEVGFEAERTVAFNPVPPTKISESGGIFPNREIPTSTSTASFAFPESGRLYSSTAMFWSMYVNCPWAVCSSRPTSQIRTAAVPPPAKAGVKKDTLVCAMLERL